MHKFPASHENCGGKFWRKIVAENFCGKLLRKILAPHKILGGYTEFRPLVKIQAHDKNLRA
jgi:hypothetical protein